MALPASGTIRLSDCLAEHGLTQSNRSLSSFYRGGTYVANGTLNSAVPTSGTIKFSNMYGTASYFVLSKTFAADENNYSVGASAVAAGWNQVKPLYVEATVNSGIVVGSASTAAYSYDTSGYTYPTGSTMRITNNGYIIGAGGQGASGSGSDGGNLAAGHAGGPAMKVDMTTYITNNGIIGGGGGGSGRAGFGGGTGGRGAGGAGRIPGPIVGAGNATAGTLLYGGTTQYGGICGSGTQPDPFQYGNYGSTLGQDGDVGGYGGLGGTGGNAIVGISFVNYVVQGRVHGRTS